MDVSELVAYLGLAIDEESWERGNELLEKARSGVEKLGEARKKEGEGAKKEGEEAGEFQETLEKGLEAFVGYEGLKSISELVDHTVEATIAAKHLGERLGITTEAVQSLGYAASLSGVSAGVLQSAMQRLSYGLNAAGHQSKSLAAAFAKLGLSQADLKKESVDQNLEEIANKFAAMADGAEKNALAMQIFGRTAGPQMVPFLNQGQAGIVALREEAVALGVTMGEEGVKKAEEFERSQKKLQARWGAIKDDIAMMLIPTITKLMGAFAALLEFLRNNQDVLLGILGTLAAAMGVLAFETIKASLAADGLFAKWIRIVGPIAMAVAAGILFKKLLDELPTPLKIILGVVTLIALAAAVIWGPITLIQAAIFAITVIVAELADHWDSISDTLDDIGEWFRSAGEWIANGFGKAVQWISDKIDAMIKKLDDAKGRIASIIGDISDVVGGGGAGHAYAGAIQDAAYQSQMHDASGERTAQPITVHSSVTIHAGSANADEVHEMIKTHMEDTIRQAHSDVKKGG